MEALKDRDGYWANLGQPRTLKGCKKASSTLLVEEYIRENVRREENGYVPMKKIRADFLEWSLARNRLVPDAGYPSLGKALRRAVFDLCRNYREVDGEGVWVYQGIVLDPQWRRGETPAS